MDAESRPEEPEGENGPGSAREPEGELGGRARLSKHAVVDRALKLADADGLDTLTIRKLAQDLGVTPMALYWHFRSKEELLLALADRVWSEIDIDVDPALPWSRQLRGLLESLVQALRAHPCASQLLLETEKQSEPFQRATEVTLDVLRRGGGFDPLHASAVARNMLWAGLMLVMSEPGAKPGVSQEELAEHQRLARVRMAMLPADRYPNIVECAGPLTACDNPEFHYSFGIDLFIAGVEAMSGKSRHSKDPAG
jgi:TetR/AcrR family transcriptional regulator, tetracycline repressor protein